MDIFSNWRSSSEQLVYKPFRFFVSTLWRLRMRFVDYHVHSNHSCDGKSSIPEMCQKAVELRIEEIGFSEHMDFEPKDWGYGFFNYERYSSEIEAAEESPRTS